MNIAIIGRGGRENVIREKLKDHYAIHYSSDERLKYCDLIIPSMEKDLVEGKYHQLNVPVFGPSKEAAIIEGSKIFSKKFMSDYKIPTPRYTVCNNRIHALKIISINDVIKLDGLAGGKGVYLYSNFEEAFSIINYIYAREEKAKIIIEERIEGEEVSVMAFCNGHDLELMPQIKDYKRILDKDKGKNTGGMGAIGPVNILSETELKEIKDHMMKVVKILKYKGVLYAGIIKNSQGYYFLEFNCRFGDPETQVALNLLESDLYTIMDACVNGKELDVKWNKKYCAAVVLSHEDYPDRKLNEGVDVHIDQLDNDIKVYWANKTGKKTTGGRVGSVVHVSDSLAFSLNKIYNNIHRITYPGRFYRRDIGYKYLLKEGETKRLKLAVLCSGKGTSLSKLIEYDKIDIIITDKKDRALHRGLENNIKTLYLPTIDYTQLINILDSLDIDLIYAVGFMRIIPKFFCDYYKGKLFNIHPSLLPDYANMVSMNIHQKVIDNKERFTGCTLHQISEEVDRGRIMWQKQMTIIQGLKNPEFLKSQVQNLEKDLLYDFLTFYQHQKLNYKDSGVDIQKGDNFVELIKNEDIGSFCSITDFNGILVASSTDGVGTKLDLARQYNEYRNLGFDLVAMCVNDLYARGAEPKIFLDYIAMSNLDPDVSLVIIDSIKRACTEANIKLVGGETAEMPGTYKYKHFDLAGFTVGVIDNIFPKTEKMETNMPIYALPSNGVHSNGFSLIRKLLKFNKYDDIGKFLKPTKIYKECLDIIKAEGDNLLGMAHITGGGLSGNIKRIIPLGFNITIDIEIKDEFEWIMEKSRSNYNEMISTFNCGYGMAFIFREPPKFQGLQFIGYIHA